MTLEMIVQADYIVDRFYIRAMSLMFSAFVINVFLT